MRYWRVTFTEDGKLYTVREIDGARVQLNLQRQRDRRAEIRLETLIEARAEWRSARNFASWLDREIEELTKPSVAA